MPTYHPAYLLRNPAAKPEVWADLQLVMAFLGLSQRAQTLHRNLAPDFSVGILLGLTAALCWGVSDFVASITSRRVGSYRVSFFIQPIGFVILNLFLWLTGGFGRLLTIHGWQAWSWTIAVGVMNAVCSVCFYHALEIGVLAIVAPISTSYPALTLMLSLLSGERLGALQYAGVVAILAGVMLAAMSSTSAGTPTANAPPRHKHFALSRGVGWALAAAVSMGVMFWTLGFEVVPRVGVWAPVWMIRLTSFAILGVMAKPIRQTIALPKAGVWWLLGSVGILDTSAFVANDLAVQWGPLSVVTVLASLFSAVTVLLACIFLREKLERRQWAGIILILAGIAVVNLR